MKKSPSTFRRLGKDQEELEKPQELRTLLQLILAASILATCVIVPPALALYYYPTTTLCVALGIIIWFLIYWRKVTLQMEAHTPEPPPPLVCPKCGGKNHKSAWSGFWNGIRNDGTRDSGGYDYKECVDCACRFKRYSDRDGYNDSEICPDDEWNDRMERDRKRHEKERKWPFMEDTTKSPT